MIIKMNADKSLQITKSDVVYQGENNANNIVFFIPKNIGNINTENAKVTASFVLPDDNELTRIMNISESKYTDYIECTEAIKEDMTVYSGVVSINIQIEADADVIVKSGSVNFLVNEQREHECCCYNN